MAREAAPPPARGAFQRDLDGLEGLVAELGGLAEGSLRQALLAFADEDLGVCEAVIAGDDAVDERFAAVEREALLLIARQAPVASDARLLTGAMHIGLRLERIGDLGVNVAELTKLAAGLPRDPVVLQDLREMGATALAMVHEVMRAFGERDAGACLELPVTDDRVDDLNRSVLERVLSIETPRERRRWGVYMDELARQLERAGDHAVDIAEQVWFVITGERREFTGRASVRHG
jgi:phosphate transport system protein